MTSMNYGLLEWIQHTILTVFVRLMRLMDVQHV